MSDGRVPGRRAAPVPPDAGQTDAGQTDAGQTDASAANPAQLEAREQQVAEPNVVHMWSGPVSVRQPSASIAVDDALVAPTGYQTAAHEVIADPPPKPAPRWALGVLALAIAFGGVLAEGAGIAVASAGDDLLGTVLAVIAIGLTALGAVLGIVAIVVRRGRRWGVAAAVLGILLNPLVLVLVLGTLADAVSLN